MNIKKMLVKEYGWAYSTDGEIEPYEIWGESAKIIWFRQTLKDGDILTFNSNYVILMVHTEDKSTEDNPTE